MPARQSFSVATERGIALLTVLLLLMLTSSILAGFLVTTTTDQKLRGVDRSRTKAFYAAHGGLEKLTADLGDLFNTNFAPDRTDLGILEDEPPSVTNVTYDASDGLGYKITPKLGYDVNNFPISDGNTTIASGPFEGLKALITEYTLTSTAHTIDGSEARLQRAMQTVSIPIFQFGFFSDTDLSFFAGPVFAFGGRVHTNGNLYLASGATLSLGDKVTAFREIIRTNLSNGWAVTSGYTGAVQPITAPGAYRSLTTGEGSLVNTIGSAQNEPMWTNRSIGTYHGYIRNGRTGAKRLDLPLITVGASPIEIIKRPVAGENTLITEQRLFSQAGFRILLSNTAAQITNLADSSNTIQPIHIDTLANLVAGGVAAGGRPVALSSGVTLQGYRSAPNTPLIDGFLKIEYRAANDAWSDVTAEVLGLGFTKYNLEGAGCSTVANNPSPNAIIRFQRIKTVPVGGTVCLPTAATTSNYWPLTLYDTREGKPRDNEATGSSNIYLSGVMHYVEFDVNNFRRWLLGQIGTTGINVVNEGGFTVYFSDRRTNQDAGGNATGEYGNEDVVNPSSANGVANSALDAGEDFNANGTLEQYGKTARLAATLTSNVAVACVAAGTSCAPVTLAATQAGAPLISTAGPSTIVVASGVTNAAAILARAGEIAKSNRPLLFRRAMKIVNGAQGQLPTSGLNITSENPVYVVGPFNATNAAYANPHAAAAIIADAVTLLSQSWTDANSFAFPNNPASRPRGTTYFRFATIAGKGISFTRSGVNCGGTCFQDFGTDGGTHNFLRMLEGGGNTINYRGAIASLYYSRQATGTYKCCTNVYAPPTRGYAFDTEFLTPSLLPPKTPMFRDVNTTGFVALTRRQ